MTETLFGGPVLPPAYPERAAWGTAPKLRAWQQEALDSYFSTHPKDFLAVATPGAGKTTFALRVASMLIEANVVNRVTIVAPTDHLKRQWADAAAKVGIALDPAYSGRKGRTSSDFVGIAMTYAGVAANPLAHRIRTERFKTEQAAIQWVVQYVCWGDDLDTSDKALGYAQVVEAVAAKHGQTLDQAATSIGAPPICTSLRATRNGRASGKAAKAPSPRWGGSARTLS